MLRNWRTKRRVKRGMRLSLAQEPEPGAARTHAAGACTLSEPARKERREEAVARLLLDASPHPAELAARLAGAGYSLPPHIGTL